VSLTTMGEMLTTARAEGRAVGAFEVWGLASVQAAVSAAEECNRPVILQLSPYEIGFAGCSDVARIVIDHAWQASVPVALHLDHGDSFERVMQCIGAGFTSVMLDASHLPFEENIAATQEVVRAAHACGVTVEAELGRIGGSETSVDVSDDATALTDPDEAGDFVARTGIDALAVAVGTVHGFYKGEPKIRLDLLEKIAKKVAIPLVLHGGSGTPDDVVRRAIALGVAKVNICTEFLAAYVERFIAHRDEPDFRFLSDSVFTGPREAMRDVILRKIRLLSG